MRLSQKDKVVLGTDLIDTWEHVRGSETAVLVTDINAELRKGYDTNRFGKWRRGVESLPEPVAEIMRYDVFIALAGREDGETLFNALRLPKQQRR